ncbi:pentalenene synthase [Leptodontidium sp. MPI-SDFR-AT-0119]|nr:pentalenene synthase [Leptodontidium sp. MPI-SDFR-AT-0119]
MSPLVMEGLTTTINPTPKITMAPTSKKLARPVVARQDSHNGIFFPKIDVPHGKMLVIIPDMFTSFMALPPTINQFYLDVRAESEVWICDKLKASERLGAIIAKTDFSLFCAISAPDADKAELRTMCDWGNWVFPFDDMFDNGDLKNDPTASRKIMDNLLSIMRDGPRERRSNDALIDIHDTVWERVSKVSAKGSTDPYVWQQQELRIRDVKDRFLEAMSQYCDGALEVVEHHARGGRLDLQEYMAIRRRSAGVTPVIAMINIPEAVYRHYSIEELKRVCADVIAIQNDILSYSKEEAEGVTHNLIAVLRQGGMSTQQAFDHAGEMLKDCYRDWYIAQSQVPQVSQATDYDIQKYIDAVRNIMLANLNWSFKSERYLGQKNSLARKYRTVIVLDEHDGFATHDQGLEDFI